MNFLFFLGLGLMIVAPLLRRHGKASLVLAGGSLAVLTFTVSGLVHVDSRIGQAAIESNRKECLFCLACQIPVFVLAVLSWKNFKWAFWTAWGINLAFSLIILAVVIELTFFWHW
jgi:hypothetical protein